MKEGGGEGECPPPPKITLIEILNSSKARGGPISAKGEDAKREGNNNYCLLGREVSTRS